MSDILTDAIRYWEPRRISYNAVLIIIVVILFCASWPSSVSRINADSVELLFVLAVLANVAYCAAYVVDVVAQSSAFRLTWVRHRWLLFVVGLAFASILAKFFASKLVEYAA